MTSRPASPETPMAYTSQQQQGEMATRCSTRCVITPFSHIWEIRNYSWFLANKNRLKSSQFVCPEGDHSWYLVVYLKGSKEEYSEYLSLYLYFNSTHSTERNIRASYEFSILDHNGNKVHSHRSKEEGYTFQLGNNLCNWGVHRFIRTRDIPDRHWLQDGKLIIQCEVWEIREMTTPAEPIVEKTEENMIIDFSPGFAEFLLKKEFTDLVIEAGQKRLDAHKVIVCAASRVFKSMFEANLNECQLSKIKIEDFEFEVVRAMVEFLYTKKVDTMDQHASELIMISDKYDIGSLKRYCENYLCSKITPENALKLLALAQHCNCSYLEDKCITFIKANAKAVFDRRDWLPFSASTSIKPNSQSVTF